MKTYFKFNRLYCGQHMECEPEHSGRQIQFPAIAPMKSTRIFSSPFLGGLPPWLAHPVGVLLVMLLFLSSSALGAEEGDFVYERAGVGARVTGYRGSGGAVVLPERLGGLPVTSIGNNAFNYQRSLTRVTIPNSVTSIGPVAFHGCTGLTGAYFQGQPPTSPFGSVFLAVAPTTVYYLPGSTGWDRTFGGRPTALWLPQMRNVTARSGGQDNPFGFDVSWAPGQTVVVEAATDLAAPVWSPVQTLTLTGDSIPFSDPQGTSQPVRFYRLSTP